MSVIDGSAIERSATELVKQRLEERLRLATKREKDKHANSYGEDISHERVLEARVALRALERAEDAEAHRHSLAEAIYRVALKLHTYVIEMNNVDKMLDAKKEVDDADDVWGPDACLSLVLADLLDIDSAGEEALSVESRDYATRLVHEMWERMQKLRGEREEKEGDDG